MIRTVLRSAQLACLVACLVLSIAAGRAHAQVDYHELIRDAEQEHKDGEYAAARDLFRRALAARQTSVALYGIAMTSQDLKDHAEAVRMARAALDKNDGLLPSHQQSQLRDLIRNTMPFVVELIVQSNPRDVQVAVDGEVIALGPSHEIVVMPGRRTIRALADGFVPYLTEVNVVAGTRDTLVIELVPPIRPSSNFGNDDDAFETEEEDDGPNLVVPIILVSVGAATLIAGGITGIVALDNEGDLENRCGTIMDACPRSNSAVAHSAEDLAVATNVLWIVGGLTSAVGITWLVLALTGEESDGGTAATLDVGPDRAGLRFSGSF
jgi:hypothetical protein